MLIKFSNEIRQKAKFVMTALAQIKGFFRGPQSEGYMIHNYNDI